MNPISPVTYFRIHLTADAVADKRTIILREPHFGDRFVSGMEVNANGDPLGVRHIIQAEAVESREQMVCDLHYGKLVKAA